MIFFFPPSVFTTRAAPFFPAAHLRAGVSPRLLTVSWLRDQWLSIMSGIINDICSLNQRDQPFLCDGGYWKAIKGLRELTDESDPAQ